MPVTTSLTLNVSRIAMHEGNAVIRCYLIINLTVKRFAA